MSGTASTVFITVPKYVAISTANSLPKIRPAPAITTTMQLLKPMSADSGDSSDGFVAPRGKKRRLDHLTWEEKVQRKKLKNRVAAQTSRDRKKARMEEMEVEIKNLSSKTEILQNKCDTLQAMNDSLMEKNQKLDKELILLREELSALQQQQQQQQSNNGAVQTVATCSGCKSIFNGSAAGINSNGLTVATSAIEKDTLIGSTLEDCNTLPSLQDMLLFDDAEFDASKLEELAETLLADITANLEADDRTHNEAVAEITGGAERLSGSMVGTTAECLESCESDKIDSLNNATPPQKTANFASKTVIANSNKNKNDEDDNDENKKCNSNTPDTVYGTYDVNTNSITILVDDVNVSEAVEEIYSDDDEMQKIKTTDALFISNMSPPPTPTPMPMQMHMDEDEDDAHILYDPIETFLCPKRPLISPLGKSPTPSLLSAMSDHGYESVLGSPSSHLESSIEDYSWNSSFDELFPNLI